MLKDIFTDTEISVILTALDLASKQGMNNKNLVINAINIFDKIENILKSEFETEQNKTEK